MLFRFLFRLNFEDEGASYKRDIDSFLVHCGSTAAAERGMCRRPVSYKIVSLNINSNSTS